MEALVDGQLSTVDHSHREQIPANETPLKLNRTSDAKPTSLYLNSSPAHAAEVSQVHISPEVLGQLPAPQTDSFESLPGGLSRNLSNKTQPQSGRVAVQAEVEHLMASPPGDTLKTSLISPSDGSLQLNSKSLPTAVSQQIHLGVPIPAVFGNPDAAGITTTSEQSLQIAQIADNFTQTVESSGGGPTTSSYHQAWNTAAYKADQIFKQQYGNMAFEAMQASIGAR
jgi:hypothetical protein